MREAARKAGAGAEKRRRLRRWLTAAAIGETAVLGAGLLGKSGAEFSFIRLQEQYQAEWAVPEKVREDSMGPWDIYGVRFDRSRLEIQFYHQIRQMPGS